MRIVIPVMYWKREHVFRVWAEHMNEVRTELKHEIIILIAGSEGNKSRQLARHYGFSYIEVPNTPIGAKANKRLQAAKKYNPDYVLLMADDSFMSLKSFKKYIKKAKEGYEEIACWDVYNFDIIANELSYSPGYRRFSETKKDQPIAPCRMLSKRICDRLKWSGWLESETKYLDSHIHKSLKKTKHRKIYMELDKEMIFNMEVKSNINMTPFQWFDWWEKKDVSVLNNFFSKKIISRLMEVKDLLNMNETYLGTQHL